MYGTIPITFVCIQITTIFNGRSLLLENVSVSLHADGRGVVFLLASVLASDTSCVVGHVVKQ
jgi:hypothetical protein